ncbi:hypothetical protein BH11ARM2_BH11ARM2_20740 [soil metagenome]
MSEPLLTPASLPFVLALAVVTGICLRRMWAMHGSWLPRRSAGPLLSLAAFGVAGMAARSSASRWEPWGPALFAGIAAFVLFGLAGKIAWPRQGAAWIGHSAVVRRGGASRGHPGTAKLLDARGKVRVEPLRGDERFATGDQVLLVHAERDRYLAVADVPGSQA